MKTILYAKGSRGLAVLKGMIENDSIPETIIIEKEEVEIIQIATQKRIKLEITKQINDETHLNFVGKQTPDLMIAAGFSKIFSKKLLEIPNIATINCHGGRLPRYRGASPIPWQIINGETFGSCYILKMQEGIDDGEIYFEKEYSIDPKDDATSVTLKCNEIFRKAIPQVIKQINIGNVSLRKQENEGVRIWTRRKPEDGLIEFTKLSSIQINNLVRGLKSPYPGAFFWIGDNKIIVQEISLPNIDYHGIPGRYVGMRSGKPIIIAKDRGIAIEKIVIAGQNDSCFPPKYGTDLK